MQAPSGEQPAPQHHLSIVLPAFNEEDNIEEAVVARHEVAERLCADHEIIVVDDGSPDRTADVVRSWRPATRASGSCRTASNRGYGEALRSGFLAARKDLVFFTDADNQFDLDELERVPAVDRPGRRGGRLPHQPPGPVHAAAQRQGVEPAGAGRCSTSRSATSTAPSSCSGATCFEELDLESVGAMVNTELMVKVGRSGARRSSSSACTHYPRTAGEARGAHPQGHRRPLIELARMYRKLRGRGPRTPARPSRRR